MIEQLSKINHHNNDDKMEISDIPDATTIADVTQDVTTEVI